MTEQQTASSNQSVTGFGSYTEYLKSILGSPKTSRYNELFSYLKRDIQQPFPPGELLLRTIRVQVDARRPVFIHSYDPKAVAEPDDETQYQIVLLQYHMNTDLSWKAKQNKDIIDALGNKLKMPPAFWYLLLTQLKQLPLSKHSELLPYDLPEFKNLFEMENGSLLVLRPCHITYPIGMVDDSGSERFVTNFSRPISQPQV